ncbi:MAG: hypothetical protein QME75_01635 [Deltaproteobacteria bacterium]|nr:hypothetical protein [Deltaproteobacteria bacterium]
MPTLLFVFGAYSLYALFTLWSRYRRIDFRGERYGAKSPRLVLSGGAAVLGCLILLVFGFSPPAPHQTPRLAGVLGGFELELKTAKAELAAENLPPVNGGQGEHPAYALLHPETPPMLEPAKPASSVSPSRRPKIKRPVKSGMPKRQTASKSAKREKPANNFQIKKNKSDSANESILVRRTYSSLIRQDSLR